MEPLQQPNDYTNPYLPPVAVSDEAKSERLPFARTVFFVVNSGTFVLMFTGFVLIVLQFGDGAAGLVKTIL